MITGLSLRRFGKFAGAEFALRKTTFFLGANEAGKSTIFDAIFDKLCSPRGTTTAAKSLRARYGDDRDASLTFDGTPFTIEADEFLSLFAIRSGEIDLPVNEGAGWLERVKSRLFSGGLDPGAIARSFDKEASESGSAGPMRRYNAIAKELAASEGQLEDLESRRERLLSRDSDIGSAAAELADCESRLAKALANYGERAAFLDGQRAGADYEALKTALLVLDRRDALRQEERILAPFRTDESATLDRLAESVRAGEAARAAIEALRAEAVSQRDATFRRVADATSARSTASAQSDLAAQILRTLPGRTRGGLPVVASLLIAAGAALLGALLGALALANLVPGVPRVFAAVAGGVTFAVVALVILLVAGSLARGGGESAALAPAKDEWRRRMGSSGAEDLLAAETYQGLIMALGLRERAADEAGKRLADVSHDAEVGDATVRLRSEELDRNDRDLAAARSRLADWLKAHGTPDVSWYQKRRAEAAALDQRLRESATEIARLAQQFGIADEPALRGEIGARMERLAASVEPPAASADIKRAESELAGLEGEIERLRADRSRLADLVSSGRGEVRGSLGELPVEIVRMQQSIDSLRGQMERIERTRRAAARAKGLFETMAEDSGLMLGELAAEVGRVYGELLGAEREVALDRIDVAGATATDAGGSRRGVNELSSGTRDCFLLAARLALAARAREGEGILVLDDPFLALDAARVAKAMDCIARFQTITGWQVVGFSKDPATEREVRRAFRDPAIIALGS